MATCRSCHAPILWAVTVAGKAMPLDRDPVSDGNVRLTGRGGKVPECEVLGQPSLDGDPRYRPHWSSCPHADSWRRR